MADVLATQNVRAIGWSNLGTKGSCFVSAGAVCGAQPFAN